MVFKRTIRPVGDLTHCSIEPPYGESIADDPGLRGHPSRRTNRDLTDEAPAHGWHGSLAPLGLQNARAALRPTAVKGKYAPVVERCKRR